ncbi:embigin [Cottoperca gobio]|uniref:Embigin n=1 Tax=Cottoperca gobio TaxID=56716 RepID=A0A6J2QAS7_COTGO|nr:embigin [Cottoperca gobio]
MQRADRGIINMSASWKQLFFQILLLLVSCRHINTKTPGPMPPPLIPISQLPSDVRSVVLKGESQTEKVELLNPVNLTLECTWTGNQDKLPNITGFWRKDGDEVENSRLTVQMENDQYNMKRVFGIVSEENLGSYSCVFGSKAKIDFVLAGTDHLHRSGDVRDKPMVSYVGDSVVIECKMEETKPKPSTWNWYRANNTDKEQIFADEEPLRYEIKNEERKTKLVVHNLTEADGGLYYCGAVYAISTAMSHVELKVISFHEPLKPFLAIVIEVIVLVAAILLYERSQSKKDLTAENGTADPTNALTQGENNGPEEGSSTRQRKV